MIPFFTFELKLNINQLHHTMIEATHLGKQSTYPQHYNPELLVAVPRILNREQYNIQNDNLPFTGIDVWHAYEFSFILNNGFPVVGIIKLIFPCNSKYLVESKSLKLYLNSFNMERFGTTHQEAINKTTSIIQKDLSNCLKCEVEIAFFDYKSKQTPLDFADYIILDDKPTVFKKSQFETYTESPSLLEGTIKARHIKWGSHLLRSNCKITNQPDWGTIYFQMKGGCLPTPSSIMQYIVSLRNENHFHEEICEMVYVRLLEKYEPDELTVSCLYTRRGGIDINPIRSTSPNLYPKNLSDHTIFSGSAFRQ